MDKQTPEYTAPSIEELDVSQGPVETAAGQSQVG